jgi:hypothetical protein
MWIDFRGIQDEYMRHRAIDYFENSRRARYIQQLPAGDFVVLIEHRALAAGVLWFTEPLNFNKTHTS